MDDRAAHRGTKRHARLRHNPQAPVLWVDDEEDWKIAHKPGQALVCPEPDCKIALVAVENLNNRHNPRFFKFKPESKGCGHWPAQNRSGPETPEHDWMKARLTSIIVRHLGYQATPEHWHTRADVFVHKPAFCFEVQLQSTQFAARTASRQRKGAEVCWFLPCRLDSHTARTALFHGQGVWFHVVDRQSYRPIAPWESPDDRDLAHRAIIRVFGTVAHAPRRGQEPDPTDGRSDAEWFRTGSLDGYQFIREVLSGKRRWHPAGTIGNKTGLWALDTDVAAYHDFCERQQAHLDLVRRQHQEQETRPKLPAPPTELKEHAPPAAVPGTTPMPKLSVPASRSTPAPAGDIRPPRRRWWQLWRRTS